MRQIIAILTALHVLAHATLGCCAHLPSAVHHGDADCHHAPAADCPHEHGAADRQAAEATDHRDHNPPAPNHQCRHDSCHWTLAKDDAAPVVLSAAWDLPANAASIAAETNAATPRLQEFEPRGELLALPVRLHLLFGVLTI